MLTQCNKIISMSIVGTEFLAVLRLWSPLLSSWVFFSTFPLYSWGLQGGILIKDGAKRRLNKLDHFSLWPNDRCHLIYVINSIYLGKNVGLCTTPKYLIWRQQHVTLRIEWNLVREARDNALHYIHFEIIGDPCSLIDSHWHDLFVNYTISCSKSHLWPSQWGIQQPTPCLKKPNKL